MAASVSAAGAAAAAGPQPELPPGAVFSSQDIRYNYDWWSYPKEYYWFSPQPLPVAWYEFFPVAALTTLFAMFCNSHVNAPLTTLWIKAMRLLGRLFRQTAPKTAALSPEGLVSEALSELTGGALGEDAGLSFDSDLSLEQAGLASVGLPLLVGLLNSKDERLGLKVSEVAPLHNLGELVELIAVKRRVVEQDSGLGTAPL